MKRFSHPGSLAKWIPGLRQEWQLDETHNCKNCSRNISKQVKCSWEGTLFSTTNLIYIVFHLLITLAAYSLFVYYNGTKAGKRFSQKTIQQAKREEGHPKNIRIILVAWGCFVILRPVELVWWLLHVPENAQQKLKQQIEPWVQDTSDLWPFEFSWVNQDSSNHSLHLLYTKQGIAVSAMQPKQSIPPRLGNMGKEFSAQKAIENKIIVLRQGWKNYH